MSLKGIGDYTAAAIASFAFNQPYAVVDGNVFRVLARFFGIQTPVDSTEGKKLFRSLANSLIDKKEPAEYNQAIMDFGAVVCKPVLPLCQECPLQKKCIASQKNFVSILPIKEKGIKTRQRFFNYLVVQRGGKIYINQRTEKDIWQNLYEFILIETDRMIPENEFLKSQSFKNYLMEKILRLIKFPKHISQKLTHQTITGRFIHITLKKAAQPLKKYTPVSKNELKKLAFPKFITSYLQD